MDEVVSCLISSIRANIWHFFMGPENQFFVGFSGINRDT
jgi:hypothetical protein